MKHPLIKNVTKKGYELLSSFALVVLAIGTYFYHIVEGWSIIDSLYFSAMTLTTIGYGDLVPTISISKIFTIIYAIIGIGIIFGFITKIASDK